MAFIDLLDRPIAFHRSFVTLTGSVTAALMLSQAMYWAKRTSDPEGWFYKTQDDWQEETGLSRFEQESARKCLMALGVWHEERRGIPAKLYYRIDLAALEKALRYQIAENQQTRVRETSNLVCGKPANLSAINQQTNTENTTETTTERWGSVTENTIVQRGQVFDPPTPPLKKDPILQRKETHRKNLTLEESVFERIGSDLSVKLREVQEISGRRGAAWYGWLREHVALHMERLGPEFPAAIAAAVKAFHASSDPKRWGLQDFVKALEGYTPPPKPVRKPTREEQLAAILADI